MSVGLFQRSRTRGGSPCKPNIPLPRKRTSTTHTCLGHGACLADTASSALSNTYSHVAHQPPKTMMRLSPRPDSSSPNGRVLTVGERRTRSLLAQRRTIKGEGRRHGRPGSCATAQQQRGVNVSSARSPAAPLARRSAPPGRDRRLHWHLIRRTHIAHRPQRMFALARTVCNAEVGPRSGADGRSQRPALQAMAPAPTAGAPRAWAARQRAAHEATAARACDVRSCARPVHRQLGSLYA